MGRGCFSDAFLRKDQETIEDLYRSNGFRDVQVNCSVDRSYQGKTGQLAVTVTIDEGSQWMVDGLSLQGVWQADRKELTSQFASVAGQPFADRSEERRVGKEARS